MERLQFWMMFYILDIDEYFQRQRTAYDYLHVMRLLDPTSKLFTRRGL